MIEGLLIALLILSIILLVLLIYMIFFKKNKEDYNLEKIINRLEKNIKSEVNDSLLKFNNEVNRQLLHSSELLNKNIGDFKLNTNTQISAFQEKISDKFNLEFKSLSASLEKRMSEINEKVEDRLSKGFKDAQVTFVDIAKRVEVIDKAQKNIKELSEEMVSLQNILSHNQSRGAYGEYQLNQLLFSIYGHNNKLYQTQYTIKEANHSVRVDAAIFMPDPNGIIGIDSKFPYSAYAKLFDNKNLRKDEENKLLSDFSRQVKKHITDIANKYIKPPITTDYALMFVPSDGILALLHSQLQNVVEYAREKFVTIVSPTTIVPLLSSFKTFMIDYERSRNMEKINNELIKLSKDFTIFNKEWQKLSRSIQTVKNDTDKFDSRVEKINVKFDSINNVGIEDKKNQ